ncbi:MAG: cytochrome c [Candidatus Promineifilaceae bacterium]
MSERTRRGLIIIGLVALPFIFGLLVTYQVIRIEFPTDMQYQPSIDYQEGPRLLPAADTVPIQGRSMVLDVIPSNPIPVDEVSLQRGEILYSIHCALCHGESGEGEGPLVEYYQDRPPSDLTSPGVGAQFDGALFRTLSQGFGQMPTMAENLTSRERWDVINYVRHLGE